MKRITRRLGRVAAGTVVGAGLIFGATVVAPVQTEVVVSAEEAAEDAPDSSLVDTAEAGSNNGTTNWYSSRSCTASGGNLAVTNYDKIVQGTVWQEYHIDADRSGGTGSVPKVYWKRTGTSTWNLFSYWNDFYWRMTNEWQMHDFKVTFSNGTSCAMGAL